MPTLPEQAFLPHRHLDDEERRLLADRRDQLFALCTPAERELLREVAAWHVAGDPRLLRSPNILSDSAAAAFTYRTFRTFGGAEAPGPVVMSLAKLSETVSRLEQWRAQRSGAGLAARLASKLEEGAAEVLLGAIHFLRVLPLQVGFDAQRDFEAQLGDLTRRCVACDTVPAALRFGAVQRCSLWPVDVAGWMNLPGDLQMHAWRLLLELAAEDIAAAVQVVDQHWDRPESPLLSELALHEDPHLAFRLARTFRAHRPDFAAALLGRSIWDSSFQLAKLEPPAAAALEAVMDASCQLLAQWAFGPPTLGRKALRDALAHLFRFGNPAHDDWPGIAGRAMATLDERDPAARHGGALWMLAQVMFYGDPASACTREALQAFNAIAAQRVSEGNNWEWGLSLALGEITGGLSLLEDKVLSGRNRRVPPDPGHFLLQAVDGVLDTLLVRLVTAEPHAALWHRVCLIRELGHKGQLRKHHGLLRTEFEDRARAFPCDAGLALKQLVAYCGYSQVPDEMYKMQLCQESFDLLLPVLEAISPADAAVARTGIGWRPPRPD